MFAHGDICVMYDDKRHVCMQTRKVTGEVSSHKLNVQLTGTMIHKVTKMWPFIYEHNLYYAVYHYHRLYVYAQNVPSPTRIIVYSLHDKSESAPLLAHDVLFTNRIGRFLETDKHGMIGFRYISIGSGIRIIWVNMRTLEVGEERMHVESYITNVKSETYVHLEPLNYDRIRDVHYVIMHKFIGYTDDDCSIQKHVVRDNLIATCISISVKALENLKPAVHLFHSYGGCSVSYSIWGNIIAFYMTSANVYCSFDIDSMEIRYFLRLRQISAEHFAPINEHVVIRGEYEFTNDRTAVDYVLVFTNNIDSSSCVISMELPAMVLAHEGSVHAICIIN